MKEHVNILVLSAGRRRRLCDLFLETLRLRGVSFSFFVADSNPEFSAVCRSSEHVIKLPRVDDAGYIDSLMDYVNQKKINIIIPTIDPEISALSSLDLSLFSHKVFPVVSAKDIVDQFYSKFSSEKTFQSLGFKTPLNLNTVSASDLPVFAKLNYSSSSIGAQKVDDVDFFRFLKAQNKEYVFQEFVSGDEYTVDVYKNRKGNCVSVVPRKRIEVRGGEVSKGVTCKDRRIMDIVRKFSEKVDGLRGPFCVQLFDTGKDYSFIEVNPRFGGGYPLTHLSGANFFDFILKDYFGEETVYSDSWLDKQLMLRYDHEVVVSL